jgi:hypothetical protein
MNNFINSKMAKITYFAAGMIGIIVLMGFVFTNSTLTASTEAKAPNMQFTETAHDFGKVPQGPQIQYNFKFVNKGAGTLIIEKVSTSCGCTGATVGDKKEYAKGEEGQIQVTFNTQGREGTQEKTLVVHSNDPEHEKVLKITCEIDPSMQ